jgi:hypothetical protein
MLSPPDSLLPLCCFVKSIQVIFRVPIADGVALYGSKYVDIGTFAMDHNALAGNSNCDHMHDGLGFITNHVAQTVQFEQALQAVNPRVSVPYWDYTIGKTKCSHRLPPPAALPR